MSPKDISNKDRRRLRRERNLAAKELRRGQYQLKVIPGKYPEPRKVTVRDYELEPE